LRRDKVETLVRRYLQGLDELRVIERDPFLSAHLDISDQVSMHTRCLGALRHAFLLGLSDLLKPAEGKLLRTFSAPLAGFL